MWWLLFSRKLFLFVFRWASVSLLFSLGFFLHEKEILRFTKMCFGWTLVKLKYVAKWKMLWGFGNGNLMWSRPSVRPSGHSKIRGNITSWNNKQQCELSMLFLGPICERYLNSWTNYWLANYAPSSSSPVFYHNHVVLHCFYCHSVRKPAQFMTFISSKRHQF